MSSYGTSNEVERGTMQTITKLGVSILLVVIMLIFSFYEESVLMSVLLGTPARVLSSLALTAIVCVVLACGMGESFLLRSRAGLGLSMWVFLPWTTITAVIWAWTTWFSSPSCSTERTRRSRSKSASSVAVGACAFSDP